VLVPALSLMPSTGPGTQHSTNSRQVKEQDRATHKGSPPQASMHSRPDPGEEGRLLRIQCAPTLQGSPGRQAPPSEDGALMSWAVWGFALPRVLPVFCIAAEGREAAGVVAHTYKPSTKEDEA
jgi:hypothetical protein